MNIGVDMDEVLAELMDQLIGFYNRRTNGKFRKVDFETYKLSETWGISRKEAVGVVEDFFKSDDFRSIRPVEGAPEACRQLKERGHRLTVISSRPRSLEKETREWLERYFPEIFSEVILTDECGAKRGRKARVCANLSIDYLIEDGAHYAEECLSEKTRVILLEKPWNMDFENRDVLRARDWDEIVGMIG